MSTLGPRLITSPHLRSLQRWVAAAGRRLTGAQPTVHYFHQTDDPHSALAARALVHLEDSYGVRVRAHLVPPPAAAAAPDAERLKTWALRDAARLAAGLGLTPVWTRAPEPGAVHAAAGALAVCASAADFAATSQRVEAAWRADGHGADIHEQSAADAGKALARGAALRQRLGHYLGAMFHFEGEWYWGLDRLGHLEDRLRSLQPDALPFVPRRDVSLSPARVPPGTVLEAFVSLRSPYTYLAVPRLTALAEATGATLKIRPVLPMVMRGLPVPLAKRLYIVRDTKREAERLGLRFGAIADPVGAPAERGLAVLVRAIRDGTGEAFLLSFLQGVFADGIDAGTDDGLVRLCTRAGLSEADMRDALADDSWRGITEANRADMLAAGIWGVPAFRVVSGGMPGQAQWGQDRLWVIEDDLHALATGKTPPASCA